MSTLPLLLLQFIVAVACLTAATVAGCVLHRHIFRTAKNSLAGDDEVGERVARGHVTSAACSPVAVSLFWPSFFSGDTVLRRHALFFLPLIMFLTWRGPSYPAIRASYRRQAPARVALLSLMLWSGACMAWTFCSFSMFSNARNTRQFGPYDYFGPSRIVSFANASGGGEQGCKEQLMQLEWECHNSTSTSNGGAVQCNYKTDVIFGYQSGNYTFYVDKVQGWFNVYNVGGLDCGSLAGAVFDDDDAGSPTSGPYVDILANCTGSSSSGACSAPYLLGSFYSKELRLPRTYVVQGWILAGLAASASLVSAYLAFRPQGQQQKKKKLVPEKANMVVISPSKQSV